MNENIFGYHQPLKKIVENIFGIESICKKTRVQKYVSARQVYCVILRELGYTYTQIANTIGVTHSNVIHHIRTAEFDLKTKHMYDKYMACKMIINDETKSVFYSKDIESIIDHVTDLEVQNESLRFKVAEMEMRDKRFKEIFSAIRSRLKPGGEEEMLSKVNRILNGL
jgi:predicted transcriptional regulator